MSESTEAILTTDQTVNGQFVSADGTKMVRVYSAKRYSQAENGMSLLMHTPDHCWTSAGWKLEMAEPPYVDCSLHGVAIRFERRLFVAGGQEELVYFGALFGGKPLPYRLDQYLAWGATNPRGEGAFRHLTSRLCDQKLWRMAWNSFLNRTACGGSQQFIRISTPVTGNDIATADQLLQSFLPLWLVRGDYQGEVAAWKAAKGRGRKTEDR